MNIYLPLFGPIRILPRWRIVYQRSALHRRAPLSATVSALPPVGLLTRSLRPRCLALESLITRRCIRIPCLGLQVSIPSPGNRAEILGLLGSYRPKAKYVSHAFNLPVSIAIITHM